MARISRTRLGLKQQREALVRFERFLPALKLRQQQIQLRLQGAEAALAAARRRLRAAEDAFGAYAAVLGDPAGVDVRALAAPVEVRVGSANVAGVHVPVLEDVLFRDVAYSLFATPPWVDRALADLRTIGRHRAEVDVLERQCALLRRELTRVVQRVNLFEKVRIPETRQALQKIRIHLGDEMAAAVGRAKIAKLRLSNGEADRGREVGP